MTPEGKSDRWWQVYCAAIGGPIIGAPHRGDLVGAAAEAGHIANEAMCAHGTKEEGRNVEGAGNKTWRAEMLCSGTWEACSSLMSESSAHSVADTCRVEDPRGEYRVRALHVVERD